VLLPPSLQLFCTTTPLKVWDLSQSQESETLQLYPAGEDVAVSSLHTPTVSCLFVLPWTSLYLSLYLTTSVNTDVQRADLAAQWWEGKRGGGVAHFAPPPPKHTSHHHPQAFLTLSQSSKSR